MALTKSIVAADGRESPSAYATIFGMRIVPLRKTATFTLRLYHNKAARDRDVEKAIDQPIEIQFTQDCPFDVPGHAWERLRNLPPAELATALGISVTESGEWEEQLADWRAAHPFYDDLFHPDLLPNGGHAKALYKWAVRFHPYFSEQWSNA